ncbi:MAG: ParB N-terminal domain-containing protein [Thermodesulfobacteriota bacterium]
MFEAAPARVREAEILDPEPFLLSWGADLSSLRESIGRVGQVSPLVLRPLADRFQLVCGHRRRRVMRDLGFTEYLALVLSRRVDEKQALLLALEENLGHRVFNDAEKTLAVKALSRFFQLHEIAAGYLSRLDLPPRVEVAERFLALAELGNAGLDALASGRLDPETALRLLGRPEEDRAAAASLLAALEPGLNKRRQILTWLEEIARREGLSFETILSSAEVREVLDSPTLNRPQKERRVRERLRRRRYPGLTALERERAVRLEALDLPPELSFQADPAFEGLSFSFTLTFTDLEGFRRGAGVLNRVADDDNLAALIGLG